MQSLVPLTRFMFKHRIESLFVARASTFEVTPRQTACSLQQFDVHVNCLF